jgi:hypothetical protein
MHLDFCRHDAIDRNRIGRSGERRRCFVISSEIFVSCSSDSAAAFDAADCDDVSAKAVETEDSSSAVRTRRVRIEGLAV